MGPATWADQADDLTRRRARPAGRGLTLLARAGPIARYAAWDSRTSRARNPPTSWGPGGSAPSASGGSCRRRRGSMGRSAALSTSASSSPKDASQRRRRRQPPPAPMTSPSQPVPVARRPREAERVSESQSPHIVTTAAEACSRSASSPRKADDCIRHTADTKLILCGNRPHRSRSWRCSCGRSKDPKFGRSIWGADQWPAGDKQGQRLAQVKRRLPPVVLRGGSSCGAG